jgi:hypothetical protein
MFIVTIVKLRMYLWAARLHQILIRRNYRGSPTNRPNGFEYILESLNQIEFDFAQPATTLKLVGRTIV